MDDTLNQEFPVIDNNNALAATLVPLLQLTAP